MLTPDYIQKAPDLVINQFRDLEDELIKSVAKRIKKMEGVTSSTIYELNMLDEFGLNDGIDEKLLNELEELGLQFGEVLTGAKEESFYNLVKNYNYVPESEFAKNVVEAIERQTKSEFEKLSRSVGFVSDNRFLPSSEYLKEILNKGIFQISSGAFSYDAVAMRYIKELGDKGVRVFHFESGQTREMETHLRRIMTDGVRQLSNEYSKKVAEDLGTDLMEISAHSGARPSHADWQGQIVSLSGKRGYLSLEDIGDGEVDGFGGANCRHSMYPYFEGSERNYSEEYLEELQSKTVEYDGKVYTDYEATQRQRALERGLRASQRRIRGLEAVGDIKGLQAEKIRFKRKLDGYKAFSDGVGKKKRMDNLIRYKVKL